MSGRAASAFKSILTYTAIVVVTLLVGEILARTYDWTRPAREAQVGDQLGPLRYNHYQDGYGDLVPRQDGHWITWFHRPYHVETNSVGLRSTAEPSDGAFRILALGDSQTYGPYLANEDTWPGWLDSYLRRGRPDSVQVFNAGIAGYTIIDELALLREKGVAFKPDLVILAVYENDLNDLERESNNSVRRPTRRRSTGLVTEVENFLGKHSALVGLADHVRNRMQLAAAGVDVRRGEERAVPSSPKPAQSGSHPKAVRYGELFGEMIALLKSHGIRLAVIFIPAPNALDGSEKSLTEPVIRALTGQSGTPYLDLTEPMRAQAEAPERLYLLQRAPATNNLIGNAHLSREGNAVIGRHVADWLKASNLVAK